MLITALFTLFFFTLVIFILIIICVIILSFLLSTELAANYLSMSVTFRLASFFILNLLSYIYD